jgi:hypothetical protein
MIEEQAEGENALQGNEHGIYTLTSSDLGTINDLEKMKTSYLMGLDSMTPTDRVESLKSLLVNMQVLMEKYQFREYLKSNVVDGYTFYYVQEHLAETEGELDFIRLSCQISFTAWEGVLKTLGVGIPTYRSSVKKKVIDSLFSLASDIDEDKLIRGFEDFDGKYCGHTKFDFFAYCVSHMWEYDLDFNCVFVGKARSSKSTAALQFVKRAYEYRGQDIYQKVNGRPLYESWVDGRCIYDTKQGSDAIRTGQKDFNLWDETYRTHDRRKSMTKGQVGLTSDMNFYASNQNVNLMLIQNFSDMDLRATTKANAVVIVLERGRGLLLVDARYIPLAKDQFNLEELISRPDILKYAPMAIHMIKRMGSYVCELNWDKLEESDSFYSYYMATKKKTQERLMLNPIATNTSTQKNTIQKLLEGGMRQIDIAKALKVTSGYVNRIATGAP